MKAFDCCRLTHLWICGHSTKCRWFDLPNVNAFTIFQPFHMLIQSVILHFWYEANRIAKNRNMWSFIGTEWHYRMFRLLTDFIRHHIFRMRAGAVEWNLTNGKGQWNETIMPRHSAKTISFYLEWELRKALWRISFLSTPRVHFIRMGGFFSISSFIRMRSGFRLIANSVECFSLQRALWHGNVPRLSSLTCFASICHSALSSFFRLWFGADHNNCIMMRTRVNLHRFTSNQMKIQSNTMTIAISNWVVNLIICYKYTTI